MAAADPSSAVNALPADQVASLAVVEKAGALALSLELPPEAQFAQPEVRFGPCLTPLSACDPQMSPHSSYSPGFCYSAQSPAARSPYIYSNPSTPVLFASKSTAAQPAKSLIALSPGTPGAEIRSPGLIAVSPSPTRVEARTPGSEIRRNAEKFGIPLSFQRMDGELAVPIPVRTTSGLVVAPSPTSRAPPSVSAPGATDGLPTVDNRPFVTPLSAGLRGRGVPRARGGA